MLGLNKQVWQPLLLLLLCFCTRPSTCPSPFLSLWLSFLTLPFLFHFCHPTLSAPFFPLPAPAVPFFLVLLFFILVSSLLLLVCCSFSPWLIPLLLHPIHVLVCLLCYSAFCLFCSSLPDFSSYFFLVFISCYSSSPSPCFSPLSSLVALVTQLYKTICKASQCCELDP